MTVTRDEISAVLAYASGHDNREVTDTMRMAWESAANYAGWTYTAAMEAAVAHYAESGEWLKASHITARIRQSQKLTALPAGTGTAPMSPREIARRVLVLAESIDPKRITATESRIDGWATMFEGEPVWLSEAVAAVKAHYRAPDSYALMPGDVLAYCKTQPIWSSREHVDHCLTEWAQYPSTPAFDYYAGIRQPDYEPPNDIDRQHERAWVLAEHGRWIDNNRERLITAIMERRTAPWGQQ